MQSCVDGLKLTSTASKWPKYLVKLLISFPLVSDTLITDLKLLVIDIVNPNRARVVKKKASDGLIEF